MKTIRLNGVITGDGIPVTKDRKPGYSLSKPRVIADNNTIHIRGFWLDGIYGMMLLKMGRRVFGFANVARNNGGAVFPY